MLEENNKKLAKSQRFTWDDLKVEIERQEAGSINGVSSKPKEAKKASSSFSDKDGNLPHPDPHVLALTRLTVVADELTNTDIENIRLLPADDRARLLLKLHPSPGIIKLSKEFVEREIMTLREQAATDDMDWNLSELDRRLDSQQEFCLRFDRALRVQYRNVLQPQRQWHRRQVWQNFNKPRISRVLVP